MLHNLRQEFTQSLSGTGALRGHVPKDKGNWHNNVMITWPPMRSYDALPQLHICHSCCDEEAAHHLHGSRVQSRAQQLHAHTTMRVTIRRWPIIMRQLSSKQSSITAWHPIHSMIWYYNTRLQMCTCVPPPFHVHDIYCY